MGVHVYTGTCTTYSIGEYQIDLSLLKLQVPLMQRVEYECCDFTNFINFVSHNLLQYMKARIVISRREMKIPVAQAPFVKAK